MNRTRCPFILVLLFVTMMFSGCGASDTTKPEGTVNRKFELQAKILSSGKELSDSEKKEYQSLWARELANDKLYYAHKYALEIAQKGNAKMDWEITKVDQYSPDRAAVQINYYIKQDYKENSGTQVYELAKNDLSDNWFIINERKLTILDKR